MPKLSRLISLLLLSGLLAGCAKPDTPGQATPMPAEFLPTAIALTLQAKGVSIITPTPSTPSASPSPALVSIRTSTRVNPTPTQTASRTATPTATLTATAKVVPSATRTGFSSAAPVSENLAAVTPGIISTVVISAALSNSPTSPVKAALPDSSKPTPAPEIPDARIQIYQLGERSLVTSPILLTARLTSQTGKVVRVELFGEDGRLLARHVRTFNSIPWLSVKIGVNLDFEIRAAAEEGRLVISVEDPHGRLIDVNSVTLILLSQGVTELNPATALWQRIVIQEPAPKALIQGGKLIASGRAKPNTKLPLKVMLIGEDGKLLGMRLASVTAPIPGDYGNFIAEVPYNVLEMTPALMVVQEEDGIPSDIALLASQEVILVP